jgi:hypothetical protein
MEKQFEELRNLAHELKKIGDTFPIRKEKDIKKENKLKKQSWERLQNKENLIKVKEQNSINRSCEINNFARKGEEKLLNNFVETINKIIQKNKFEYEVTQIDKQLRNLTTNEEKRKLTEKMAELISPYKSHIYNLQKFINAILYILVESGIDESILVEQYAGAVEIVNDPVKIIYLTKFEKRLEEKYQLPFLHKTTKDLLKKTDIDNIKQIALYLLSVCNKNLKEEVVEKILFTIEKVE